MPDQVPGTDRLPVVRAQGAPVPGELLGASPVPPGRGERRERVSVELLRAGWRNRDQLGLAARSLAQGVCHECGLGPRGLRDDTLGGLHLCGLRLRALRQHTIGALAPADLLDVERLRQASADDLFALGRLPQPFVMAAGDRGFSRLPWEDALRVAGAALRETSPSSTAFLAGGRGLSDETIYVLRKAAALLGCNNVDLCGGRGGRRVLGLLEAATGVAASTCAFSDLFAADLVVLLATDLQERQPVALRYLVHAKRQGCRVLVVDTHRDRALESCRAVDGPRSALFGTRLMDDFIQVRPGGAGPLLTLLLKQVIARGAVATDFVARHTVGFDALAERLAGQSDEALLDASGADARQAAWAAELLSRARRCVTVLGDRVADTDPVALRSVINLHLVRGFMGDEGSGILSLAGPPSALAANMLGLDPRRLPGRRPLDAACGLDEHWGSAPLSAVPGLDEGEIVAAADRGELDLLVDMEGDLLATADPARVARALGRTRLRVHATRFLRPEHLVPAEQAVILLPLESRLEQAGGGLTTSVERRIRFSPEVPGPRLAHARPGWWVPGQLALVARPDLRAALAFEDAQRIRDEIERVVPDFRGVASLRRAGDWVQWGGRRLHDSGFRAMPGGRARFLGPEDDGF